MTETPCDALTSPNSALRRLRKANLRKKYAHTLELCVRTLRLAAITPGLREC